MTCFLLTDDVITYYPTGTCSTLRKLQSQKVQVPNIQEVWSQKPYPQWLLGSESLNIENLDPLRICYPSSSDLHSSLWVASRNLQARKEAAEAARQATSPVTLVRKPEHLNYQQNYKGFENNCKFLLPKILIRS